MPFGAVALAAIGCWIAFSENVVLTIDLEVDRAGQAELRVGDRRMPVPVSLGRQALRFEHLPLPLPTELRLDPSKERGVRVRIYAIEMSRGGVVGTRLARLDLSERLSFSNVTVTSLVPLEMVTNNIFPILVVRGPLEPGPARVPSLRHITPERVLAVGIAVFLALGALRGRAIAGILPVLVAVAVSAWSIAARWLDGRLGGPQPVSKAIGWANFQGSPKLSDFRLLFVSFGFALVAGLALGRLVPRRESVPPPPPHPRSRAAIAAVWLPLAIFAGLSLPDLGTLVASIASALHDITWEYTNVFIWEYFLRHGWATFRDFFFPYGELSTWYGAPPWAQVRLYAHELLLMAVFGLAIWRLTRRSWGWTFAIIGITVAAILSESVIDTARYGIGGSPLSLDSGAAVVQPESLFDMARYFLSLDLALLFLAARDAQYGPRALLAVAAFGIYAFVMEPQQVVYAAVPIAILVGIDAWRGPRAGWDRRDLARRFAPAAIVFAGGVLAYLMVLHIQGRLAGLADFLRHVDTMAIYSSLPVDVPRLLTPQVAPVAMVAFAPLLLVAFGGAVLARASGPEDDRLAAISIGLGFLPLLPASKYLVRPHILSQFWVFAALGLALVARELVRRAARSQRRMLGAAAALSAGLMAPALVPLAYGLEQVPGRAVRDAAMIARDAREYARDDEAYFFDVSRYVQHRPVIERLVELGVRPYGSPGSRVYDFGDDPVLYAALRQAPPFYVTFFSACPLDAQRRMGAWLGESAPEWLVWRPVIASAGFDGVPNTARVPLMFAAAIEGYRPFESIGDFDIMRRGRPAAREALLYWRARLGDAVDLGAIPSLSELSRADRCSGVGHCIEALRVHLDSPAAGRPRWIPIGVDGELFAIAFTEQSGVTDYFVHLERVWFWGPMRTLGARPVILPTPTGCRAELVSVAPDRELLW